ncbi:hypothetical protein [Ornithinibacillus xuwenensis]|uniref:Transcriptional regulator n=1 Tax=Ornithinibacillus xuwenensis TaxID=3144668 RepID=A0ABU9XNH3_9BACI
MDEKSLLKKLSEEELKEYMKHRKALNNALTTKEAKIHYHHAKAILDGKAKPPSDS